MDEDDLEEFKERVPEELTEEELLELEEKYTAEGQEKGKLLKKNKNLQENSGKDFY